MGPVVSVTSSGCGRLGRLWVSHSLPSRQAESGERHGVQAKQEVTRPNCSSVGGLPWLLHSGLQHMMRYHAVQADALLCSSNFSRVDFAALGALPSCCASPRHLGALWGRFA